MPRKQQKKNPVSFLAGGHGFIRTIQKAPQVPPRESEINVATPEDRAKAIESRMLSYRVDTILHPTLPKWNCVHGKPITEDEIRFQALWKRKFHTPKEPPISFECIQCYPICIHGLKLTPKEVNSGNRFSKTCPKCAGKFTNAASLAAYLEKQQLSENYGLSLSEGVLVTSFGYRVLKSGENFVQGGGSKETEQIDAAQFSTGPVGGSGHGPDDHYDFDGEKVDDLGDPVSFTPSELTKGFEKARTEETKETLEKSEGDLPEEIEHNTQDVLSTGIPGHDAD